MARDTPPNDPGSAFSGAEKAVVAVAVAALVYRALVYPRMVPGADGAFATRDIVDFALGMVVFIVAGVCAVSAVVMSTKIEASEQHRAFRPAVVGITTFVVYYFLHPHVPPLP